jgi:hypothetical protein
MSEKSNRQRGIQQTRKEKERRLALEIKIGCY